MMGTTEYAPLCACMGVVGTSGGGWRSGKRAGLRWHRASSSQTSHRRLAAFRQDPDFRPKEEPLEESVARVPLRIGSQTVWEEMGGSPGGCHTLLTPAQCCRTSGLSAGLSSCGARGWPVHGRGRKGIHWLQRPTKLWGVHEEISQQKMNGPRLILNYLQGLRAIGRPQDGKPCLIEDRGTEIDHGLLIVDHEDDLLRRMR